MMMIPAKSNIVDTNNSQWLTFSVSDLCPQRRHSPTRNYTTEHKLTLPKLLNIMEFKPSLKRISYETLASIKHRTLTENDYKYSINNKIRCASLDISSVPLETNKPLIDRGLGE